MITFRAIYKKLTAWWQHEGEGDLLLQALALVKDASLERMKAGLEARFPSLAGKSAQALIGADRAIRRGRVESDATYARRLKKWRYPRGHRVRGNAFALLDQIWAYFASDDKTGIYCWTIDAHGNRHTRDVDGTESYSYGNAWNWDDTQYATSVFPTFPDAKNDHDGEGVNVTRAAIAIDAPSGGAACVALNGIDQHIEVENYGALNFERTDDFSIAVWIRATLAAEGVIVGKNTADATAPAGWHISMTSAGAIFVTLRNTLTTNEAAITTDTSGFDDGAWHHVIVTYDGSSLASGINVYVDNVLQPKTIVADTLISSIRSSTGNVRIGRLTSGDAFALGGRLHKLAIYDKVLSGAERTAIYGGGTSVDFLSVGPTANLLAYWRLGEEDADYAQTSWFDDSPKHWGRFWIVLEPQPQLDVTPWPSFDGGAYGVTFDEAAAADLTIDSQGISHSDAEAIIDLVKNPRIRWKPAGVRAEFALVVYADHNTAPPEPNGNWGSWAGRDPAFGYWYLR